MAHVGDKQILWFGIAFFVVVCLWLAVFWLRIAGVLASRTDDVFDPELPPNIVLEAVLKD
jgi:F0F1-type ATP synthase membrane subunit b/b'